MSFFTISTFTCADQPQRTWAPSLPRGSAACRGASPAPNSQLELALPCEVVSGFAMVCRFTQSAPFWWLSLPEQVNTESGKGTGKQKVNDYYYYFGTALVPIFERTQPAESPEPLDVGTPCKAAVTNVNLEPVYRRSSLVPVIMVIGTMKKHLQCLVLKPICALAFIMAWCLAIKGGIKPTYCVGWHSAKLSCFIIQCDSACGQF